MNIKNFALNSFLSDIKLKSSENGEEFYAHKLVLITQSELFNQIIQNHHQVETIVLPHPIQASKRQVDFMSYQKQSKQIKDDHFSKVMHLVYLQMENAESVKEEIAQIVTKQNCFTFYSLCNSLGFEKLRKYFEEYIVCYINKENDGIDLLYESVLYQSDGLRNAALKMIAPRFQDFLRSSYLFTQLINLPFEAFKSLIRRDDISVSEESDIFNIVYQYILKRESDPEPNMPQVSEQQINIQINNKQENTNKSIDQNKLEEPKHLQEVIKLEQKSVNLPSQIQNCPSPQEGDQQQITGKNPLQNEEMKNSDKQSENTIIIQEMLKNPTEEQIQIKEEEVKDSAGEAKDNVQTGGGSIKAEQIKDTFHKEEVNVKGEELKVIEEKENVKREEEVKIFVIKDDLEDQAYRRLINNRLTKQQKSELLLSVRLGYLSHEVLLKYSNTEVLDEFKDIFLQAISSKLNYFDSQEFMNSYEFNLNPRNSYSEKVNNLSMIHNISKAEFGGRSLNALDVNDDQKRGRTYIAENHIDNDQRSLSLSPHQNAFSNDENNQHGKIITPQKLSQNQLQQVESTLFNHQSHLQGVVTKNKEQNGNLSSIHSFPLVPRISKINEQQFNNSSLNSSTQTLLKQSNLQFVYKFDFDDNGALNYIGTMGKTKPYVNPSLLGQVHAFASSVRVGKAEFFVGRETLNLSTCNEKLSYLGLDLGVERSLYPTAYSIRNRNSTTYVLLNWVLEGSADGEHFIPIDQRIYYDPNDPLYNKQIEQQREALKVRGATSSYAIDQFALKRKLTDHRIQAFRYFRIVQTSQNSHGSDNLSLSGFELYGISFGNGWL